MAQLITRRYRSPTRPKRFSDSSVSHDPLETEKLCGIGMLMILAGLGSGKDALRQNGVKPETFKTSGSYADGHREKKWRTQQETFE